jgi:hypothetical protein
VRQVQDAGRPTQGIRAELVEESGAAGRPGLPSELMEQSRAGKVEWGRWRLLGDQGYPRSW